MANEDIPYEHRKGVLGIDPNSPHKLAKSTLNYSTVTQYINEHGFFGSYPVSFNGQPDYFTETGCAPLFSVHPNDDYSTGVMTINQMIEMTFLGIPWQLGNREEITVIMKAVADYKEYVNKLVSPGEDIIIYIQKIDVFIKHINRLQQEYEYETNKTKPRIVDIFSALGSMIISR